MSQDKLSILKNYKTNLNEFKITTNLILAVQFCAICILFHSLPTDKSSIASVQHILLSQNWREVPQIYLQR